jgi:tRNA(Ile2) C34 agmatinyltransferase TiaS
VRQPSYGADGVYATEYTAYSPLAGPEQLQVLVAADQLELACEVVARPIPPEIVALSKVQLDDFEPPKCPRCGAVDPILEGVTPTNSWLCEGCGNRWNEWAGDQGGISRGKS